MKNKKIYKVILIIWIIIWAWFNVRQFIKDKTLFGKYIKLACADEAGRRAIVYGEYFYKFLKFCKANIPQNAKYQIVGVKADSIDLPRMIYYLYPALRNDDADFILVYKKPFFSKEGTDIYASLDDESFILRYRR